MDLELYFTTPTIVPSQPQYICLVAGNGFTRTVSVSKPFLFKPRPEQLDFLNKILQRYLHHMKEGPCDCCRTAGEMLCRCKHVPETVPSNQTSVPATLSVCCQVPWVT